MITQANSSTSNCNVSLSHPAVEYLMKTRNLFMTVTGALLLSCLSHAKLHATPLLAVDFGGPLVNNFVQPGFQAMQGTNDLLTSATFGAYTVQLSANNARPPGTNATNRGFFSKLPGFGGRIDNTPAAHRFLYSDFFFNRSTVNGEGIDLQITGLTPNVPYTLSLASFDADASNTPANFTAVNWGPKAGSNTTGSTNTVNMLREPVPASLWDPAHSTSITVSTSTGILDIFGTTSAGSRGSVLNGFKLNDGVSDVLSVDLGEGAAASVQPGFLHMTGPDVTDMATQSFGAYTITAERVGGAPGDTGFYNEYAIRMGAEILPPATHNMFRDCFYNVSIFPGDGVKLTIDGVTPNTEYDLTIWDMDPATTIPTPTTWTPINDTTGQEGNVVNVRTPVPQTIDDPNHLTTIRVMSTTTKLEIFATTSDGFGGVRLNAFALNAVGGATTPGDFNSDGDVDSLDLGILKTNFGATSATFSMGDADADADVDGTDFLVWQRNVETGSPASTVPEPSGLAIVVLAALTTLGAGRVAVAPSSRTKGDG